MAAVSAQRHSQDVSFQNFTPETELSKHDDDCVEDDIEEIVASDVEAAAEQVKDEEDTDSNNQHKAEVESKGKFTLGIDDGAEFMDELSFSIQHCGLSPAQAQDEGQSQEAGAGVVVEGVGTLPIVVTGCLISDDNDYFTKCLLWNPLCK